MNCRSGAEERAVLKVGVVYFEAFASSCSSSVMLCSSLPTRSPTATETDGRYIIRSSAFCGDERYVALTLIGDLAKRNFAEKHHII
jgi:hypothetical protein